METSENVNLAQVRYANMPLLSVAVSTIRYGVRKSIALISLVVIAMSCSSRAPSPGAEALSLELSWPSVLPATGPEAVVDARLRNIGATPVTICQTDGGGVTVFAKTEGGQEFAVSPLVHGAVSDA